MILHDDEVYSPSCVSSSFRIFFVVTYHSPLKFILQYYSQITTSDGVCGSMSITLSVFVLGSMQRTSYT